MSSIQPFIALTDQRWFEFLAGRADSGRVDEVNFWSPRATRPMKRFAPGEPIFLRLKRPHHAIAGYGFFAHFTVLSLGTAWAAFNWRNGDPDELSFLRRIGEYRGRDLTDRRRHDDPLACTILRDVRLWPKEQWIPWGAARGWKPNTQQGATERDPEQIRLLLDRILHDHHHQAVEAECGDRFELIDADERRLREARQITREGQGTFRARLLDAYSHRCAITGERTEPVLDAAHIQPYLGPRSNHVQNGLLLTKEFHALFDEGLVTVTPSYEVLVSPRLHERWKNGRRFYSYDRRLLVGLPEDLASRPSRDALEWHASKVFA
jgi:putative restriction endonuclease